MGIFGDALVGPLTPNMSSADLREQKRLETQALGQTANFRFCYWLEGSHVHIRVFSGKTRDTTHAKCGDLVFRFDEWPAFLACLTCGGNAHVEVVHEDESVPYSQHSEAPPIVSKVDPRVVATKVLRPKLPLIEE